MKKIAALFALMMFVVMPLFAIAPVASAQAVASPANYKEQTDAQSLTNSLSGRGLMIMGACIGAGLAIIGAGRGIGQIGGSAVEAIARQPEAGGPISTAMIISAALIEGATLFAVVVCLLVSFK